VKTLKVQIPKINLSFKEKNEQFEDKKNSSNFNFAIVGDWGCTKDTKKTVDSIEDHNPEIIFSLGGTSYGTDMNCWLDIVKPISDKMKTIVGNHDYMSPPIFQQYMENFGLSGQYHSFDYKNIHFLMMSSESTYNAGNEDRSQMLKKQNNMIMLIKICRRHQKILI